jgi:hypothetical protein
MELLTVMSALLSETETLDGRLAVISALYPLGSHKTIRQ